LSFERLGRRALCSWALLTAVLGGAAAAQTASLLDGAMPLTSPAKSTLSAVQDNWLQWDSAFLRGEEAAAELAVVDLLQATAEVGMTRLPEVCFAMLARASQSATDGNTVRARWAVEMAERLDPGRPEVAFASAAIARHEGRYFAMIGDHVRGYARLARSPLLLRLTAENLLVWALGAAILTGVLYVSLQLAVHGASMIEDLAEVATRWAPITTAYLAALVVVILPALIPPAWIALPFYWAILLMPYARRSERAVVGTVIAVLVATPALLGAQARRVELELSAPMEAARSLEERRLYGGLINDVDALRVALDGAPAAMHLTADLHQDLGQTEYARLAYQSLLEVEPLNAAAHNNLGSYYLRRRETSQAIEHLERAASIEPTRLEPHRNLWMLYRDYLAFEEAERVLARVREVSPGRVSNWFSEGPSTVMMMRDGYGRAAEIRGLLRQKQTAPALDAGQRLSPARLLPLALFLILALGVALALARLGVRARGGPRSRPAPPRGGAVRWIPGLPSLLEGRGWRAYFALLVPVAAVLLPGLTALGYRLPWGYDPGVTPAWALSAILLTLYLGARWGLARARRGDVA
jgi:tetratricopeptide (TPR) repeat protein